MMGRHARGGRRRQVTAGTLLAAAGTALGAVAAWAQLAGPPNGHIEPGTAVTLPAQLAGTSWQLRAVVVDGTVIPLPARPLPLVFTSRGVSVSDGCRRVTVSVPVSVQTASLRLLSAAPRIVTGCPDAAAARLAGAVDTALTGTLTWPSGVAGQRSVVLTAGATVLTYRPVPVTAESPAGSVPPPGR